MLELSRKQTWGSVQNLVPLPYRRVSVQRYNGPMTVEAISRLLLSREAYRRTDFIVLLGAGEETAVVAITRAESEPLFSQITSVEVLALPESCAFVYRPEVDTANRSALAGVAHELGIGPAGTLVVQGLYDHVNFIHHPRPLLVRVVEVAPPEPPKLYGLARQVLSYADLPPIRLELERIEVRNLAESVRPASYLVPCRSGGLDDLPAPVHFLDEHPERQDWTMIGCERSLQFHRHFYGDEPPRVEMCPRLIAGKRSQPTLVKCCLLETHIEQDGEMMVVPWGADLAMVEAALRKLAEEVAYA
ncbi:MAG TPA: hypothetical protein VKV40_22755 [Ktedonobacteraceae bacterium]|nr:hypothetical protein [Ktedonobacteraceae bacterium]